MDIFSTDLVITFVVVYIVGGLVFCMVSSFVSGYNGAQMQKADYYDSILWPFSVSILLGFLARVCVERVKERAEHKERKSI